MPRVPACLNQKTMPLDNREEPNQNLNKNKALEIRALDFKGFVLKTWSG